MTDSAGPSALRTPGRPKDLFRRLDELTERAFAACYGPAVFNDIAERLVVELGGELGLRAVRVERSHGSAVGSHVGVLGGRLVVRAFGRTYALGLERESPEADEEQLELVLNTLRSLLGMRLLEHSFGDTMRQAAEIQLSLLPSSAPSFPGYDIAVRCAPIEAVGGDLYDFLTLDPDTLGLAVGDASGHGLPAALLVRDVVVGMRMGMEKDFQPAHALRRLNRVIHTSALSSCFVSLFYAELETNGNLFYYNAGHEPPLLFDERGARRLASDGTVIGPLPDARFKRHFAHIDHGGTLVIYTDGLVERRGPGGELFGLERLIEAVEGGLDLEAGALVDRVFERVDSFHPGHAWEDDATILVARRRL